MTDETEKIPKVKPNGYCVECNGDVTHKGAYFCRLCAEGFYIEKEGD